MKRTAPTKSATAKKPALKKKPAVPAKKAAARAPAKRAPSPAARPKPAPKPASDSTASTAVPAPGSATKQSQLITLLRSASGATMQQMTALTGWVPDTVRGMISNSLRKRLGLTVQNQRIEGVRVYRIVEAAAQ